MVISFPCNDEAGKVLLPQEHLSLTPNPSPKGEGGGELQSVLLRITGTSTLVLRRSDIEAVTQGELDATGVVVLRLAEHHPIAVKQNMVDTTVEKIVTCQFYIQTMLDEVFADAE